MNIKEGMAQLLRRVREGEKIGCPYVVQRNGKLQLAVFSYIAAGTEPVRVYGYSRELFYDGQSVSEEKRGYFQSEEQVITVSCVPVVSREDRTAMYDRYYDALQRYVDKQTPENAAQVARCFMTVTPPEAVEMYRRMCPEFVALIGG